MADNTVTGAVTSSIRPQARPTAVSGIGAKTPARQEEKAELSFMDRITNLFTGFGGKDPKEKPASVNTHNAKISVYQDMEDEARRSAELHRQDREGMGITQSLTPEQWAQRYSKEKGVMPSFGESHIVYPEKLKVPPVEVETLPAPTTSEGLMARPITPTLPDDIVSTSLRESTSDTSMAKADIVKQVRSLVGTNIKAAGILGAFTKESGANFDTLEEGNAYSLIAAYGSWTDADVDNVLNTLPRDVQARLRADYQAGIRTGGEATTADRIQLGNAMFDTKYSGGSRYRGRGLIHITHDYNYRAVGEKIGVDLVSNPELVNDPRYAVPAALAYLELQGYFNTNTAITQNSLQRMVNPAASRTVASQRWNAAQTFLREWQSQAAPTTSPRPQARPTQE